MGTPAGLGLLPSTAGLGELAWGIRGPRAECESVSTHRCCISSIRNPQPGGKRATCPAVPGEVRLPSALVQCTFSCP